MPELGTYEREVLEYLLKTRDHPAEVRQGGKVRAIVSYVIGAGLILAASQLVPLVSSMRWVLLGLAALGGILIAYGAMHEPLRKQYEVLHEFIDFERVRAALRET